VLNNFQEQMLVGYLIFLKNTVNDEPERNAKIVKAVNDFYIGLKE
jgi:hypothetical protein